MLYYDLCVVMENVLNEKGTKNKKKIITEFLRLGSLPYSEVPCAIRWMIGQALPKGDLNLNFATNQLNKAERKLVEKPCKKLTIPDVNDAFIGLAAINGENSEDKKIQHVANLLSEVSEIEQKYIKALILGQMPVGYGISTKNMLDCIADVYSQPRDFVTEKYALCGDIGTVALKAALGQLSDINLMPFVPFKPMLAEASTIQDTLKKIKVPFVAECKYDGARCIAHKVGDKVKLYSRNLEDLTDAFPEVADGIRGVFGESSVIVDGEIVAVQDDKPLPFQVLSKRLKRQKSINEMMRQIPVKYFVFDLLWLNCIDLTKQSYKERTEKLFNLNPMYDLEIIEPADGFYCVNADSAEKDVREALEYFLNKGHEGIIIKDFSTPYLMDKREWVKIKAIQEKTTALDTLDCAITRFTYGTGKYANMLGSVGLSVLNVNDNDRLTYIGDVGTGLTDDDRKTLLQKLKPFITAEDDEGYQLIDAFNNPVIIEVAFEEVQRSSDTESGYALRFPRFVKIRDDKPLPDTLQKIEQIFNMQKKAIQ